MTFCLFVIPDHRAEETEYEYSGSDEEDENRGDDRESRFGHFFSLYIKSASVSSFINVLHL